MARPIAPMLWVAVIVGAALAGLLASGLYGTRAPSSGIGVVSQPAPQITTRTLPGIPGLDRDTITIADGQVTLVNFWASWCPPCRAEHPRLMRFANEGLRIIGVNFDDAAPEATAYLAAEGNPFAAVAFDPDSEVARAWGVDGPPQTFILAPDGTVVFHFVGPLVGSDFEQRFLPALRATQNALGVGARR